MKLVKCFSKYTTEDKRFHVSKFSAMNVSPCWKIEDQEVNKYKFVKTLKEAKEYVLSQYQ